MRMSDIALIAIVLVVAYLGYDYYQNEDNSFLSNLLSSNATPAGS